MTDVKTQREILAENLKNLLNSRGLNQTDMARDLDLKETTVSSWMNAYKYPRIDKIQLMADYFNVPRSAITEKSVRNVKSYTDQIDIPVLGKISCGYPLIVEENVVEYKSRSTESIPSGKLFYLTANGDSMEPKIPDGALVLCRQQEDVENGEIAAVLVNGDEEATLKRVRKINGIVMLEALNPSYEPYIINDENPGRIIGKAIEVTAKL